MQQKWLSRKWIGYILTTLGLLIGGLLKTDWYFYLFLIINYGIFVFVEGVLDISSIQKVEVNGTKLVFRSKKEGKKQK